MEMITIKTFFKNGIRVHFQKASPGLGQIKKEKLPLTLSGTVLNTLYIFLHLILISGHYSQFTDGEN